MNFHTNAKAVIWHEDALLIDGSAAALRPVLGALSKHGVKMAVVATGDANAMRGTILRQGLSPYFSKNASEVPVFSVADHESTIHDSAITKAFLRARDALGQHRYETLAIAESCEQVRRARYAGLPVLGYTNSPRETRERMVDYGAFFAASAAIDLHDALLQFRPFKDAKWHPDGCSP